MSCHVMSCHVMLCHVTLLCIRAGAQSCIYARARAIMYIRAGALLCIYARGRAIMYIRAGTRYYVYTRWRAIMYICARARYYVHTRAGAQTNKHNFPKFRKFCENIAEFSPNVTNFFRDFSKMQHFLKYSKCAIFFLDFFQKFADFFGKKRNFQDTKLQKK